MFDTIVIYSALKIFGMLLAAKIIFTVGPKVWKSFTDLR